jgi:isoprenylcysteine carboxyl methyltransferase (ICMT) family protein YpbQ
VVLGVLVPQWLLSHGGSEYTEVHRAFFSVVLSVLVPQWLLSHGGSEYTEVHGAFFSVVLGVLVPQWLLLSRRLRVHGGTRRVISQWSSVSWCLSGCCCHGGSECTEVHGELFLSGSQCHGVSVAVSSRRLGAQRGSRKALFSVVLCALVPQWLLSHGGSEYTEFHRAFFSVVLSVYSVTEAQSAGRFTECFILSGPQCLSASVATPSVPLN